MIANLFCTTIILSCSNDRKEGEAVIKAGPSSGAGTRAGHYDTVSHIAYFKIGPDSVTVLPFEIEVTLSPKAIERIVNSKETIIVNVSLTGLPKDKTLLAEDGEFYVATAEREITYGQVAKFDNIKFSRKTFDQLTGKDVHVNAFVYSGRKSSPDNILTCEIVADSVSRIVNKRIRITGKLIRGDN